MCPFQVETMRQFHTAIWNLTHDSFIVTDMFRLTFGERKAQSILFFQWHFHRLGFTVLDPAVLLNTSRWLLSSKQSSLWKLLRPISPATTTNHMMLFGSLGSTSFEKAKMTCARQDDLTICSCLKVSSTFQDTTINHVLLFSSGYIWYPWFQSHFGEVLCKFLWLIGLSWKVTTLTKLSYLLSLMMLTTIRLYYPFQLWHLRQKVTNFGPYFCWSKIFQCPMSLL